MTFPLTLYVASLLRVIAVTRIGINNTIKRLPCAMQRPSLFNDLLAPCRRTATTGWRNSLLQDVVAAEGVRKPGEVYRDYENIPRSVRSTMA